MRFYFISIKTSFRKWRRYIVEKLRLQLRKIDLRSQNYIRTKKDVVHGVKKAVGWLPGYSSGLAH